jgi:hypothetical protein
MAAAGLVAASLIIIFFNIVSEQKETKELIFMSF